MLDEKRQQKLEKVLQEQLIDFLSTNGREYICKNKLTPKKIELILDFVEYVEYKIDGKTSKDRAMETLDSIIGA